MRALQNLQGAVKVVSKSRNHFDQLLNTKRVVSHLTAMLVKLIQLRVCFQACLLKFFSFFNCFMLVFLNFSPFSIVSSMVNRTSSKNTISSFVPDWYGLMLVSFSYIQ